MRLIDAEKVKQYILEEGFHCDTKADKVSVAREIDKLFPTVEAIPIEWIKKWCNTQNGKSLEERLLKRYGVLTLLEDWEKENTPSMTHPAV